MNFIKKKIRDIKDSIFDDSIRRMLACYRIGFFYILFVGTVLSPIATIFHASQVLIWVLAMLFGFILASTISSSPVFTRDKIFTLSRYTMFISIGTTVLWTAIILIFHIHINPM